MGTDRIRATRRAQLANNRPCFSDFPYNTIVSENQLQKRGTSPLKDRAQYLLAFGVVASMLWVVGFPVFVIFFFGIFAYFLLRMFSSGSRSETREIFEFYLTANEILRDDDRRWFGFEISDAIKRGEDIAQRMSGAPPLVYFALGALQSKIGDHKAAVANLAYVVENTSSDEGSYAYPSPELRNYVKVLRKIERDPADAPLTSAAIRALERARRIRGKVILEESRVKFANGHHLADARPELMEAHATDVSHRENGVGGFKSIVGGQSDGSAEGSNDHRHERKTRRKKATDPVDPYSDRKPITEVLHDIYDKNVQ